MYKSSVSTLKLSSLLLDLKLSCKREAMLSNSERVQRAHFHVTWIAFFVSFLMPSLSSILSDSTFVAIHNLWLMKRLFVVICVAIVLGLPFLVLDRVTNLLVRPFTPANIEIPFAAICIVFLDMVRRYDSSSVLAITVAVGVTISGIVVVSFI